MVFREEADVSGMTTTDRVTAAEPLHVDQNTDFVADIARVSASSPSFRDGLEVQRVLDAVARSVATSSRWTRVNT